jgi:hypothetical protein
LIPLAFQNGISPHVLDSAWFFIKTLSKKKTRSGSGFRQDSIFPLLFYQAGIKTGQNAAGLDLIAATEVVRASEVFALTGLRMDAVRPIFSLCASV